MTLMGTLVMCEEFEEFLYERKNFIFILFVTYIPTYLM